MGLETGFPISTQWRKYALTFTAANEKVAQAALDKLAAAGFWGELEKPWAFKDDSGTLLPPKAKPAKLSSGVFKGAHNCCEACNKALVEAIKTVEGVESEDSKTKEGSFTVKGAFDPDDLLNPGKILPLKAFHLQ